MAKKAFFTDADHSTAATFKAWVTDLSSALDEIGFLRSADTGQIDVAAIAAKPAAASSAGYEIRYLNDSLHATAPIYVKLEYCSQSVTSPFIAVTVGTGTNGAGSITGIFGARYAPSTSISSVGSGAPFQCYACLTEGLLWVSFGVSCFGDVSFRSSLLSLVIARTTDAAGAPTADGAVTYLQRAAWDNFGPTSKSFKNSWASRTPYVGSGSRAFGGATSSTTDCQTWTSNAMGNLSSTDDDGGKQVFPHLIAFPSVKVVPQIVSMLPGDGVAHGTQFSAALVGSEPRNYLVTTGFRSSSIERFALWWE